MPVCTPSASSRLGLPCDKTGGAAAGEVWLQVGTYLLQGALVLLGMLIEKRGAVLEAPFQGIDQQRHPGSGHTRRPAVLQQLQQLLGIARQGGELLQQLQARLQGCLILAGLHRLVAQLAQFAQPQLSRRQTLA